jgi:uncharacterized repeat protein (TIGR03803 family)
MRWDKIREVSRLIVASFAIGLFMPQAASAQKTVISVFNGKDGAEPLGTLLFDSSGNLYGTTFGNKTNAGTVYELSPVAGGGWASRVLYAFKGYGYYDGQNPSGGVIRDAYGNLFGTTIYGGTSDEGMAFELIPQSAGEWKEKRLYDFGSPVEPVNPNGPLVMDAEGNLYGTAGGGGDGTVFELKQSGGTWTESVLHSFTGPDGKFPVSGLIFDAAGNLYGTTEVGGLYSEGTVFELSPGAGETWTETVLHSFKYEGTDGILPQAGVTFDAAGNLYGTTEAGGSPTCANVPGCGTVFKLSPNGDGTWAETILYDFHAPSDGYGIFSGVALDASGNVYSANTEGGSSSCSGYGCGTLFELSPTEDGKWVETVLYRFGQRDGQPSIGNPVLDNVGNIYHTTETGGPYNDGTVFRFTP